MTPERHTVFALSSGRPPAAIAVIRISGPRARIALEQLTGRVPQPRRATLATVRDPKSGELIDEGLALWFPGPNSETGEDTAELQLHGGRAVIAAVLAALAKLDGFRPAEAGEFTRRAFENGRLDLTAVEGLADLVAAETEAQRRQAFLHLKGLLGDRAETWRQRLIEALALVEAAIDFSDEDDVPEDAMARGARAIAATGREIAQATDGAGGKAARRIAGRRLRDRRMRENPRCLIVWPGGRRRSCRLFAGTTRDVIEVHSMSTVIRSRCLTPRGSANPHDPVEQEGVRRAHEQAARADLMLWVVDGNSLSDLPPQGNALGGRLGGREQGRFDAMRPPQNN